MVLIIAQSAPVTFGIIRRSASMPSGSTNDGAFPRRFHHLPGHLSQGVALDEASNLRQQTMQYTEPPPRSGAALPGTERAASRRGRTGERSPLACGASQPPQL